MVRLLADESLHGDLLRAIRKSLPTVDILSAREAGTRTLSDPDVIRRSSVLDRVIITQDLRSFEDHAYDAIAAGITIPGVIVIRCKSMAETLFQLELVLACMVPEEFRNCVTSLPL